MVFNPAFWLRQGPAYGFKWADEFPLFNGLDKKVEFRKSGIKLISKSINPYPPFGAKNYSYKEARS